MGKLGFLDFVRDQFTALPPVEKADLTGKTVIVTGANVGLGFEASKHFARMNPSRLILACRNETKGKAALEKLEEETGYKGAELWTVDLSDFSSVVAFADSFQVNCLSPFIIALCLFHRILMTGVRNKTSPRLVFVTSEMHFWVNLPKKVLESDNICKTLNSKEYNASGTGDRYPESKLLEILFCQAMNERLGPKPSVIVNTVNPGFCMSEIRRDVTGMRWFATWLTEKTLARTTEQGSRQLVYAAVGGADIEDKLCGAYISCSRVSEASDFAVGSEGRAVQNKLWSEFLDIINEVDREAWVTARNYINYTVE
ncbi:hypothetical protein H0H92_000540 [Tricholoma furcatifolium]|nr:hypothetical protein H0H92_000540 [Tricholoma furcatifolium]